MHRVSTTPDVGRMGEALARPGMDPRTWKSLAVVTKVVVDPQHGVFCDVICVPSEAPGCARLGAPYAGNGFGAYFPVKVDDEVIVGIPDGDPAAGLVIVARIWSGGDPPPAELEQHPNDPLVLCEDGATLRLAVQGAGNAVLEARGGGQVRLGAEAASRGVARQNDVITLRLSELQACLDARYQPLPGPPVPLAIQTHGDITSSSDKVRSA